MSAFALPALVTPLTVAVHVGRARIGFAIEAPVASSHPDFERADRVPMNGTEFVGAAWGVLRTLAA